MFWLSIKNPKITHKDLSFKDYLNVKSLDLTSQGKGKINVIEVVLTKQKNSDFKIEANMKNTECKIKGVLISNPICEIPKISLFNNFWSLEENKINLFLDTNSFTMQWLRLFYMHGKGQNKNSILAKLDKAIDDKLSVFNMSQGEQLRDYLPIKTVVNKIINILILKKNGIFNICSGEPISIRRLVENRIKERGSKIKINLGYYPYPKHEPMAFWGINNN